MLQNTSIQFQINSFKFKYFNNPIENVYNHAELFFIFNISYHTYILVLLIPNIWKH